MKEQATKEGTLVYSVKQMDKSIPSTGYRELGRTQLTCSILGFGSYRIDEDTTDHINALDYALQSGCNLIDTSTNYTNGSSERCIGTVLKSAIGRGSLTRQNVIVVSKVGYVQGENLEIAQEQEETGAPYPEMVKYSDGCWHCIHPKFIRDQLERSLLRTGLKMIDVYLLHNPEYFFMDALHRYTKKPVAELRQEFYKRIRAAFSCLEECVAEGLISHYGVSSNTFGNPDTSPDRTSVVEMWKIAEEIAITNSGDSRRHHFSVIQLPFNLFETGPAFEKNSAGLSTLEFAKEKHLGVLANRPLNAFVSNELVRLADFPKWEARFSLEELLKMVSLLEEEFQTQFAPKIQVDPEALQPEAYFRWADELKSTNLKKLSLDQWTHVSQEMLLPQVHYLVQELDHHFSASENKRWTDWRNNYLGSIGELVNVVKNLCSEKSQQTSNEVRALLAPELPDLWKKESLSRESLGMVAHTPGVTCVLNGMRTKDYVKDALGVLQLPAIPNCLEALTTFSKASLT